MEKRRVTMKSATLTPDGNVSTHNATDYVPMDILDAYVADARTRWQVVEVSDEHDSGPGGDDGQTNHPEHLKQGISLEQHIDNLTKAAQATAQGSSV